MAIQRDTRAGFIALNRFGLGSRGDGDLAAASGDPRGFLKAELAQPGIALLQGPGLVASKTYLQALYQDQERVRIERERKAAAAAAPAPDAGAAPPGAAMTGGGAAGGGMANTALAGGVPNSGMANSGMGATAPPQAAQAPKPAPQPPNIEQQAYRGEALARIQRATQARAGLVERLVAFWSNHFCISIAKGQFSRVSAGAFEREAIRPHVLGRFADMAIAVEQHPAMIFYLDNQQSVGPDSRAGNNRKRGLNENLAREIMELHTLGVSGGYTQTDVTALARIITGWTFAGREGRIGEPGTFQFVPNMHEPGTQTLLGKSYPDTGRTQGETALNDLARHSSTAQFIATKFARHFVADAPPPALVARLADAFRKTDGDLAALTAALIDADDAWAPSLGKMRTPYEFLIAASRLMGRVPDDPGPMMGALYAMGMPLWEPPGPNGWPDTVDAWASPEGLKLRLDIALQAATRAKDPTNPADRLDAVAGDFASSETRQAIKRAESGVQGLALLFMSPEIQRR